MATVWIQYPVEACVEAATVTSDTRTGKTLDVVRTTTVVSSCRHHRYELLIMHCGV